MDIIAISRKLLYCIYFQCKIQNEKIEESKVDNLLMAFNFPLVKLFSNYNLVCILTVISCVKESLFSPKNTEITIFFIWVHQTIIN